MKLTTQAWPEYMYCGVAGVSYLQRAPDRVIEAFAKRWGGVDVSTLERIVREGQGEDKAIAIGALGSTNSRHRRTLLAPLLHSPLRLERWTSAEALGWLHDKRALAVLHSALQDPFVPPDRPFDEESLWDIGSRTTMTSIVGDWGQPSSIPVLRSALQAMWQWEQLHLVHPFEGYEHNYVTPWQSYHYDLAYALGQLGAFGALTGIPLSDQAASVKHLPGPGDLQTRQHQHDLYMLMCKKPMQKRVAKVLEQRFGLTEAEQRFYIERYSTDFLREGSLEERHGRIYINGDEKQFEET